MCLDIVYFVHYALHDIMHVQGYNNVAGSLCLHDSILVTHFNGQFDHYHFTIFKSHTRITITTCCTESICVLLIRLLVTQTKTSRYKNKQNNQTNTKLRITRCQYKRNRVEKKKSGHNTVITPQFHMLYPLQKLTVNFVDCIPHP